MKIAYLLLLFRSIITSSNGKPLDIVYNKKYKIDVSGFPKNTIPSPITYYSEN